MFGTTGKCLRSNKSNTGATVASAVALFHLEMRKIKLNKFMGIMGAIAVLAVLISAGIYTSALNKITFDNTASGDTPEFIFTEDGLALGGVNGSSVYYDFIEPIQSKNQLDDISDICFCSFSGNGFCIVSNPREDDGNMFYDFTFSSFDGSYENKINLSFNQKIWKEITAVDNDYNLYVSSQDNGRCEILVFSSKGKLKNKVALNSSCDRLMFINGEIYAVSDGELFVLKNGSLTPISLSDPMILPCTVVGKDEFCDSSGKLITVSGGNAAITADFGRNNSLCCSSENYVLYSDGKKIRGFDKSKPDNEVYYKFDFNIDVLCRMDEKIYAGGFCDDSMTVESISEGELKSFTDETASQPTFATEQTDSTSSPERPEYTQPEQETPTAEEISDLELTSPTFIVDRNTGTISNIDCKTTVSRFRNSFLIKEKVSVISQDNKPVTKGQVGTGMKAVFENSTGKTSYTLCVSGDLTGEGNLNTLDLSAMFGYLLGKNNFSNSQLIAADLNQDGRVSNTDLVLLERKRISAE